MFDTFEIVSFLFFLLLIAVFVYRERKKAKILGVIIMRRTQRGKKFIASIAKYKFFWNSFAVLGILICFIGMYFVTKMVLGIAYNIYLGKIEMGLSLVVPTPSTEVSFQPGLLLLPWYFWVIGILSVILPHEFFHGIMAKANNIRIKSLGWMLLLFFIPGAFVEPDETQLKKSSKLTRLKVYAAGSFANFIVAFVSMVILFFFLNVVFTPSGVGFSGYIENYSAEQVELSGTIQRIGDYSIQVPEDIPVALSHYNPYDVIEVKTSKGVYFIELKQSPDNSSRAFLGIASPYWVDYQIMRPLDGLGVDEVLLFLVSFIGWIFTLSFGIGLFNLLPIKPLDGGLMIETMVSDRKWGSLFVKIISISVAAVVLYTLLGTYI